MVNDKRMGNLFIFVAKNNHPRPQNIEIYFYIGEDNGFKCYCFDRNKKYELTYLAKTRYEDLGNETYWDTRVQEVKK